MKNSLIIKLLMIFLSVSFTSCEEDKEVDACDSIYCNGGGNCVDGACNCFEGFSGVACENEQTPTRMIIKGISTLRFPDDTDWDQDNSGPDLYISILNSNFSRIFKEKSATDDCESGKTVTHNIDTDIIIDQPSRRYEFQLYDEDGIGDELVGKMSIVPYDKGEAFPKLRTVSVDGLTLRFVLEYEF